MTLPCVVQRQPKDTPLTAMRLIIMNNSIQNRIKEIFQRMGDLSQGSSLPVKNAALPHQWRNFSHPALTGLVVGTSGFILNCQLLHLSLSFTVINLLIGII
jgi:hypothetical protein